MHEMSLTDRTLAALGAAELPARRASSCRCARAGATASGGWRCWRRTCRGRGRSPGWSCSVLPFSELRLHAVGGRLHAVLRAAGEDGRAVRPRPVRPAQDDAGRGARAGRRGRDLRARRSKACRRFVYTGGSHPLLIWGILTAVLLVLTRGGARFVAVRTTAPERVLVVGDAATTAAVRRKLSGDPALNATVVGRVGVATIRHADRPDKLLGTLDELPRGARAAPRRARRRRARRRRAADDVVDVIRLATACGVRVAVLPRMLEVIGTSVGVRRPRRPDAARRARLRAVAVVARAQARVRPRGRRSPVLILLSPLLLAIALAIKLSSPGPGPVPPDARRPQRPRVPDAQVPDDGRRRRRAQARAARAQRGRADVQDRRRPAHDARRAAPAPALARRAAAALQRAARRHEPGRAAAADHRGGPALLGLAAAPLPRRPGDDRPLADPRLEPGADERHGHDRLPLLRELVALARRQDPGPDGPVRAQPPQPRVPLGPRSRRPSAPRVGGVRNVHRPCRTARRRCRPLALAAVARA